MILTKDKGMRMWGGGFGAGSGGSGGSGGSSQMPGLSGYATTDWVRGLTWWGQSLEQGGTAVTGPMTGVTSITMTGAISGATGLTLNSGAISGVTTLAASGRATVESLRIGDGVLKWDSANNAFYVEKLNGAVASFYAGGSVSALGFSAASGGGGGASALADLTDVQLGSLLGDGQVLMYNATSGKWKNGTIDLTPYATTSSLGDYLLRNGSNVMTGNLRLDSNVALKTVDGGTDGMDLLAYKTVSSGSTVNGVTMNHWFAGTGNQGVLRSSSPLIRFWQVTANGLTTDYTATILDSTNWSTYVTGFLTQSAADGRYLKLVGGSMSNANVVTNLNADLLDGHHSGYFALSQDLLDLSNDVVYKVGTQDITGAKTFKADATFGVGSGTTNSYKAKFGTDSYIRDENDTLTLLGGSGIKLDGDTTVDGDLAIGGTLTGVTSIDGMLTFVAASGTHTDDVIHLGTNNVAIFADSLGLWTDSYSEIEVVKFVPKPQTDYGVAQFAFKPQVATGSNTYSDVALVSDIGTVMTGISFLQTGQVTIYTKNVGNGQSVGDLVTTPYALASSLSNYWNTTDFKGVKVNSTTYAPLSTGTSAGWIDITDEFDSLANTISSTYVAKGGDSMTGALSMGNGVNVNYGLCAITSNATADGNKAAGTILKLTGNYVSVFAGDNADANFTVNGHIVATRPWVTTQLGGYLPLTAGSAHPLTGNIAYQGTGGTNTMITFIDNVGDLYGNGIAIGGGGATIIGGGDSAGTMSAQVSGGSEVMYIGNDQGVNIYTNLQNGWSYRKEFLFDTNGDFSLLSGVNGRKTRIDAGGGIYLTVGTSYWGNGMYAMSQADASLGEVGFFGNGDALTYMYIGAAYNNTWVVVKPSGNVGIGTTSPSEKLSVAGNIESFATNVGTTITPTGIDVTIGGFAAALIEYAAGDANYAIARFGLRPQVLTGSNTYTNVALTTDIPSVPAGRSMYFGNCQIFTNSSGTAGTELYLSGNSVHVTSDGVFTFNNEQVVTSSGVAFASKDNNSQWTLTANKGVFGSLDVSTYVNMRFSSGSFCFMQTASNKDNNFVFDFEGNIKGYSLNVGTMRISANTQTNTSDITFASTTGTALRSYNFDGDVYGVHFYPGSDIRKKDVLRYLEPSVRDVAFAPIIEFDWKDGFGGRTAEHSVGSIAQYWQSVFPQAVREGKDGMLCLEYGAVALVSAITAARSCVDNEREIAELKLRVAELEDALAALTEN